MRRFLTYWLPPLVWTAVILAASSDLFSSPHTGGWIERITSWFGPSLAPATLDLVNRVLRKIGHVTAYGILSALSFRALRGERPQWSLRWAIGAIAMAVLVASVDEFHQSFVASRTGTWHDVVLDAAGATLMQITIRAAQVLLFRPT
jgi:VanZ family protein